jgi:hypothetical protein
MNGSGVGAQSGGQGGGIGTLNQPNMLVSRKGPGAKRIVIPKPVPAAIPQSYSQFNNSSMQQQQQQYQPQSNNINTGYEMDNRGGYNSSGYNNQYPAHQQQQLHQRPPSHPQQSQQFQQQPPNHFPPPSRSSSLSIPPHQLQQQHAELNEAYHQQFHPSQQTQHHLPGSSSTAMMRGSSGGPGGQKRKLSHDIPESSNNLYSQQQHHQQQQQQQQQRTPYFSSTNRPTSGNARGGAHYLEEVHDHDSREYSRRDLQDRDNYGGSRGMGERGGEITRGKIIKPTYLIREAKKEFRISNLLTPLPVLTTTGQQKDGGDDHVAKTKKGIDKGKGKEGSIIVVDDDSADDSLPLAPPPPPAASSPSPATTTRSGQLAIEPAPTVEASEEAIVVARAIEKEVVQIVKGEERVLAVPSISEEGCLYLDSEETSDRRALEWTNYTQGRGQSSFRSTFVFILSFPLYRVLV